MKSLNITEINMKLYINAAVDSNNECPENFRCVICHSLVYEPEKCQTCENIYCKACIREWTKEKCPLC